MSSSIRDATIAICALAAALCAVGFLALKYVERADSERRIDRAEQAIERMLRPDSAGETAAAGSSRLATARRFASARLKSQGLQMYGGSEMADNGYTVTLRGQAEDAQGVRHDFLCRWEVRESSKASKWSLTACEVR